MLRKILSVIAVGAALALGAPAAHAGNDYPPPPPSSETLAGSVVAAECVGDVPWIRYDVIRTDPSGTATTDAATLVLSRGANTVEIPLGTLVDDRLSGRVLWPGAAVDAAGAATGWPGYAGQDGQWLPTDGNFAWTRGAITATVKAGSELSVPLSYPPASAACAGPKVPGAAAGIGSGLAVTGGALPLAAAGAGLALIAVGGIVVLVRRRRPAR